MVNDSKDADPAQSSPEPEVRLTDVAHRAGISLATTSRALSESPGVSADLIAHVHEIARSMGYTAHLHGELRSGSGLIGLIIGDIADPHSSGIASAIIYSAEQSGRFVQVAHADGSVAVLQQIRRLRASGVMTIVLAASTNSDRAADTAADVELESLQLSGGRVVTVGRHHLAADSVRIDNIAAGRELARHILDHGHTTVAIFAGPEHLTTVADRLAGLSAEFVEHCATVMVSHGESTSAGGAASTQALLNSADGAAVTAIIALDDTIASGVLLALRSRGIAVPSDISVAGFDDIPLAAQLFPALTTIRIEAKNIAAQTLLLAEGLPGIRPRIVMTGHELLVRESTGSKSTSPRATGKGQ